MVSDIILMMINTMFLNYKKSWKKCVLEVSESTTNIGLSYISN